LPEVNGKEYHMLKQVFSLATEMSRLVADAVKIYAMKNQTTA